MRNLAGRLANFWKAQHGVQTFEFALLLPILLLVLFGMVDLGRGYFSWLIITNGAREGARAAIVAAPLSTVAITVQNAVSGLHVTNLETSTCQSSLEGNLCVTATNIQGDSGTAVTVNVRYNFKYIVLARVMSLAGVSTLPSGVFPLTATATMRLE